MDAAAHAAALTFERGYYERAAAHASPHPLGVALRDDAVPRAHMLNMLEVAAPAAAPEELVAALDALQGHLTHRKAHVHDDALGAALVAALTERGFAAERHLTLVLRRERDRAPAPGVAEEVDEARHDAVERAVTRELPHGADETVVDELSRARAALRAAADTRFFVAADGGVDAAHATLVSGGGVAQLEDVGSLIAHRDRGLARATCCAAIDAARAAGSTLVFVIASDDDWPKELYGKLGFDVVGASWAFTRVDA